MPDRELVRRECVLYGSPQTTRRVSRPIFRIATAVAAMLVVTLLFGIIFTSTDNTFSARAYAIEIQADGSVDYREIKLNYSYHNGETNLFYFRQHDDYVYMGIFLTINGESIRSIEFNLEDGLFGRSNRSSFDDIEHFYDDDGIWTGMKAHTDNFEVIGRSFVLEPKELTDDLILFAGGYQMDFTAGSVLRAHVLVNLHDGTTQEEILYLGDFE